MEEIKRRGFQDAELAEVEAKAIELATQHTDAILKAYADRADTYGGRYVCADSFKELLPKFGDSPAHRSKYNGAVHNAAAVLASEQYRRLLVVGLHEGRDKVMFITGIPGAGKSTTVQGHALRDEVAAVFEGQMSRPGPTLEKIDLALGKGYQAGIVAVHVPPEVALDRTNKRFNDPSNGRGASISVMADIQGGLPSGLGAVEAQFGDRVTLEVLDNTPGQVRLHSGWSARTVLEKEGSHERIHQRLSAALELGHAEGRYSDAFYRQAAGKAAPERGMAARLDAGRHRDAQATERGGEAAPGTGKPVALERPRGGEGRALADAFQSLDRKQALAKHPELAASFALVDLAARKAANSTLSVEHQQQLVAAVQKEIYMRLERGDVPTLINRGHDRDDPAHAPQKAERDR